MMQGRVFELDRSLVRTLAEAVAPGENWLDVFARATWTGIAEPGDRVAGALVAALGASVALTAVIERWSVPRLLDAVRQSREDVGHADGDPGAADADELAKALERWQPRLGSDAAARSLRQAARIGATLLVPGTELWMSGLDDLGDHAPLALWWRGQPETLRALDIAIALVGARAATGYGEHVALEASAGLVDRGFAVVSGAAYGIDGMVHRSALASHGNTVAFLAGGVDRFYPSGHDGLLTRMVEVGAVLSELPCGSAPTKWRFLQRNRLIAAASSATVVLEAGWRSGSLNTAGHAASLGRPLGAVPGPVTSPASAGCHRLIRDYDAVCVTSADEMAELAGGTVSASADARAGLGAAPEEGRILDAMSARSSRTEVDIARRSGLSVAAVQSSLGRLQLEGTVAERSTGWVRT